MTDERLEWHLENWAEYCKHGRHVRGWASRSIGLRTLAGPDFDEQVEAADKRCAEAVDAIVWELPREQRESMNARYLKAIWTLKPLDRPPVMEAARKTIKAGLVKRAIA